MRPRLSCLGHPFPWRPTVQLRGFTSDRTIQENDVILLRQRGDKRAKWRLTPPLRKGSGKVRLPYGATLDAEQIIGRRMLDAIKDSTGREVILYETSLASYISHSDRMATPIYPHDANTIVSMMDLHPERPGETDDDEPFEVFEAGTGMGSLTLHIARALHAGNPSLTRGLREALATAKVRPRDPDPRASESTSQVSPPANEPATPSSSSSPVDTTTLLQLELPPHLQPEASSYLASRRAILHTLDRNPSHSRQAHRLVRRFRRALYLPTIDFHSGSIHDYLTSRLATSNGAPFLSRAILDLPAPEANAETLIRALRPNALLVLFNPSISQIAAFAAWSTRSGQPLRLDRVAELPTSSSAEQGIHDCDGGRPWKLSTVVPKDGGDLVQIMRPRVGDRVAGGGFVAVYRKCHESEVTGVEGEESVDEAGAESEGPEPRPQKT